MKIITTYKANNGDEFVRIENPNVPQDNVEYGEVNCIAEEREEPITHISYYKENGDFIGTAGTHIHRQVGTLTEYVYTKRVSEKKQMDNIAETLGYDEENETRYWFAILMDEEDNDWGDGSFDFEEAREKAKSLGAWGIARINDNHDPLCEQIYEADEWDNTDGFN